MNKEDVIKYLKENPQDVLEVAEAFDMKVKYESKHMMSVDYQILVRRRDRAEKAYRENESDVELKKAYCDAEHALYEFEQTYHYFEPHFDERMEKYWNKGLDELTAKDVYDFRSRMYHTQAIGTDKLLTDVIADDMCECWRLKGGQDEMYEAFPFTITFESVVDEKELTYDWAPYNNVPHKFTSIWKRCYALDGDGGIAIIQMSTVDTNLETNDVWKQVGGYQILTLGEDDANHFLNSARIYETFCSCDKDGKDFIEMVNKAIKEFRKCEHSAN